nr:MAG TPA: hypothetical protein [Caudoviricetes sp.]
MTYNAHRYIIKTVKEKLEKFWLTGTRKSVEQLDYILYKVSYMEEQVKSDFNISILERRKISP